MKTIIQMIEQEDKLIEQCVQVFGLENAKQEAQKHIAKAEETIRRDRQIAIEMWPTLHEFWLRKAGLNDPLSRSYLVI
jgi:hypothetical protein